MLRWWRLGLGFGRDDEADRGRHLPLSLLTGLLVIGLAAPPADAQVTLDMRALDQGSTPSQGQGGQGQGQGQTEAPETPRSRPRPPRPRRPVEPSAAAPSGRTATTKPSAAAPALSAVPPAGVTLAPIVVEPPTGRPPPQPIPAVSASAGSNVEPVEGGVRVVFAPDRTDLTSASEAQVKAFLAGVPQGDNTTYNVVAYAAGGLEDPSTPRRLSLSRALAIRSVLMADGVASARIYLRALGNANPGGPADRVDVTAMGANGTAQQAEKPK